jgi:hypothetical protein
MAPPDKNTSVARVMVPSIERADYSCYYGGDVLWYCAVVSADGGDRVETRSNRTARQGFHLASGRLMFARDISFAIISRTVCEEGTRPKLAPCFHTSTGRPITTAFLETTPATLCFERSSAIGSSGSERGAKPSSASCHNSGMAPLLLRHLAIPP